MSVVLGKYSQCLQLEGEVERGAQTQLQRMSSSSGSHKHSHREGEKSKQPNQPIQKTFQPTPPLQPHACFLYFSCLLGEVVYIHRATWLSVTSSGCTLVLQLKIEPRVVEQTVPTRL